MTFDRERIVIAVADTGIGISQDCFERLFRNFEQIKSSYGSNQQGTGLGLALTLKLAELHGGTVRVESAGEGEGSCFTIEIPINQPEAQCGELPERLQAVA
jgi:signal transduction histidine kinase